ncbi:MAG TPA: hypothetical protein DEP35_07320 [Deltaproteobacteria bacterium]|nr:hypothetical protein [Deltaproteobacteria bacterium]
MRRSDDDRDPPCAARGPGRGACRGSAPRRQGRFPHAPDAAQGCRWNRGRLTASGRSPNFSRTQTGIAFWIHVTPRAKRAGVGGSHGDALRVAVREPPLEGEANAACVRALAAALGVPAGAVILERGARGRRKRVHVEGEPSGLEARIQALASDRAS